MRPSAAEVMRGLHGFQTDAVNHVVKRFYGSDEYFGARTNRFLIADETGLGKSIIARGIIAKAIEELEKDESVEHIDIVYVCSNQDLANQNLKRLNVTGNKNIAHATRLTLLPKLGNKLDGDDSTRKAGQKQVNLVSFTPGTSFNENSLRQGNADERAMIFVLLREILNLDTSQQQTSYKLFQGTVSSAERFHEHYVKSLEWHLAKVGGVDRRIVEEFAQQISINNLDAKFLQLLNSIEQELITDRLLEEAREITSLLKRTLAKVSIGFLTPNLVIFDEFQRFRHLLTNEGGEAAALASDLYNYKDARTLLLSATPYKPFTRPEEDQENHVADFLETLKFLFGGEKLNPSEPVEKVTKLLTEYRHNLVSGENVLESALKVRSALLPVMSRSERPQLKPGRDLEDKRFVVPTPSVADIKEWLALTELGRLAKTPIHLDYWKSVPYFTNFMSGYKIDQLLKNAPKDELGKAFKKVRTLNENSLEKNRKIDLGTGPLRTLAEDTIGQGMWKLLWVPPSMPYVRPGQVYSSFEGEQITKRVIFSSWAAVPPSVAALLTHEATRRVAKGKKLPEGRLTYRVKRGKKSASVSTLALFWPHAGLAKKTDQLKLVREEKSQLDADQILTQTDKLLRHDDGVKTDQAWEAFFAYPGAFEHADIKHATEEIKHVSKTQKTEQHEAKEEQETSEGLRSAITVAKRIAASTKKQHPDLAKLAVFAPGVAAYQAVTLIADPQTNSNESIWKAAFIISEGLRSLFNRPETIALLDTLYPKKKRKKRGRSSYWNRVLDYCADGNLRALLDEYLTQLLWDTGKESLSDEELITLAETVAEALSIRPANYQAHEANHQRTVITFPTRFAVPYGSAKNSAETDSATARTNEVRTAFNSPFAPFVLVSTSVGQEGIDFHWWCHSVVHWNMPPNPVDFEQREGRVNRYGGHAVRKNVAAKHWQEIIENGNAESNPWDEAFERATIATGEGNPFSPWWIYEGTEDNHSRIQRVLLHYPLSQDFGKYKDLLGALTSYRLTLGQPRQQDLVDMLRKRGRVVEDLPAIDLSPPQH